jgi:prepilin-type N-terminal cleavage/methylation domain-containing protein
MNPQSGITLIEKLVAVAVVAILLSVSLPAFWNNYKARGRFNAFVESNKLEVDASRKQPYRGGYLKDGRYVDCAEDCKFLDKKN